MKILAIDPGINAGVALIEYEGSAAKIVEAIEVPTAGEDAKRRVSARELWNWIVERLPDHAFIENVNAFPEQGVSSSFRFGRAAGALEATIACAGVPFDLIAPQVWKKSLNLKGADKEGARVLAIRRFPSAAEILKRKKDHNLAEAILLADWGYRERLHGGK